MRLPYKNRYTKAEYADMWKLVKSEVRFRVPGGAKGVNRWSKNDKKLVRESFYFLFGHGGNAKMGVEQAPGIIQETRVRYMGPSARKTDKLKEELGQGGIPTKFAYIPAAYDPNTGKVYPVEVEHKKNEPDIITIKGVRHRSVEFDIDKMLVDSEREIERKLQDLDDLGMFQGTYSIFIDVGRHQITGLEFDENTVGNEILRLQHAYGNQSRIVRHDPRRHWTNWLRGLTVKQATRQKSLASLRDAIQKQKIAKSKKAKNWKEYEKKRKEAHQRFLKKIEGKKASLPRFGRVVEQKPRKPKKKKK